MIFTARARVRSTRKGYVFSHVGNTVVQRLKKAKTGVNMFAVSLNL